MKTSNNTTQVNGDHYDNEIEPVHIMVALNFNWFEGEILKYVSRHRRKNGVSDLNKAIHICDMSIDLDPEVHTSGWNRHVELIDKYVNQFPKEDQNSLMGIIENLYFESWECIKESIIKYKLECYVEK